MSFTRYLNTVSNIIIKGFGYTYVGPLLFPSAMSNPSVMKIKANSYPVHTRRTCGLCDCHFLWLVLRQEGASIWYRSHHGYSGGCCQGERMVPIVFALVPTIVGAGTPCIKRITDASTHGSLAAMLIGLNGKGEKGALLFGKCRSDLHRSVLVYSVHQHPTSSEPLAVRCLLYMHTMRATQAVTRRRWLSILRIYYYDCDTN